MITYRPKTILIVGLGVALIVGGAVASIWAGLSSTRLIGGLCIIVGLLAVRFSDLPNGLVSDTSLNMGERAWLDSFRSPRRPLDRVEYSIYGAAAVMFFALIGSALLGYFSDILTFSFLGVFVVAIGLLIVRRIF
jgi:hypothetical protein